MISYVFDGTMQGLLSAVFDFYERKDSKIRLLSTKNYQPEILVEVFNSASDELKANRVLKGLKKKISPRVIEKFFKAFLGDNDEIFQSLFDFCCYIFDNPAGVDKNFGHPAIIAMSKMEKSVNRERHRMKAFIRFKETGDGIYYASVEPDFNVLPLITTFFKNRYADQKWVIYDVRRCYGFYYNLINVSEIQLDFLPEIKSKTELSSEFLSADEELYTILWRDYFKHTNIPARKNMKLHIRHVPKRYWKYLTEKNPLLQ